MKVFLCCLFLTLFATPSISATPFFILNGDTLNTFDDFDYYILTDDYKSAFPDSFKIAETEFDKKDVTQRLIPLVDSLKNVLITKTYLFKDCNFKLSEYDFAKKAFYLTHEILSTIPNWKKELATSIDNYNRAVTGRKVNTTKPKKLDTLYVRGRWGCGQVNMFAHIVYPVGIPFINQVETKEINSILAVSDESKAREIAKWNVKKEDYSYHPNKPEYKGVYITMKVTKNYFAGASGQALFTNPISIICLDDEKNIVLMIPFYKGI